MGYIDRQINKGRVSSKDIFGKRETPGVTGFGSGTYMEKRIKELQKEQETKIQELTPKQKEWNETAQKIEKPMVRLTNDLKGLELVDSGERIYRSDFTPQMLEIHKNLLRQALESEQRRGKEIKTGVVDIAKKEVGEFLTDFPGTREGGTGLFWFDFTDDVVEDTNTLLDYHAHNVWKSINNAVLMATDPTAPEDKLWYQKGDEIMEEEYEIHKKINDTIKKLIINPLRQKAEANVESMTEREKEIMKPILDEEPGFSNFREYFFTMGQGAVSLGEAIGITLVTKNPKIGAAWLSGLETTNAYQEAKEAGASTQEARQSAIKQGVGTFILESIGLEYLFSPLATQGNWLMRGTKAMSVEVGEESTQQLWQNLIKKKTYDPEQRYLEGLTEAFVGTALPSFMAGIFAPGFQMTDNQVIDMIQEEGNLSRNDAETAFKDLKTAALTEKKVFNDYLRGMKDVQTKEALDKSFERMKRTINKDIPGKEELQQFEDKNYDTSAKKVEVTRITEEILPKHLREKVSKVYNKISKAQKGEKIGRVIQEDTIARDIERGQEQAAREAFVRGKEYGVFKQKEHFKNIKKRAKQRREQRELVNDLVKDIQRVSTKDMPVTYQRQIQNIKGAYDFKNRQEVTLKRRESLRNYVKNAEERGDTIDVPQKELREAFSKPLNEMTLEELKVLHDYVLSVAYQGKTKQRSIDRLRKVKLEKIRGKIINKINKGNKELGELEEKMVQDKLKRHRKFRERAADGKDVYLAKNKRMERHMETWDNFERWGPSWRNIFKPINDAENLRIRMYERQRRAIQDYVEGKKIDIDKWQKKEQSVKVRGRKTSLKITKAQRFWIYLAKDDAHHARRIQETLKLNEYGFNDLVESTEQDEKDMADFAAHIIREEIQPRVEVIFETVNGRPFPEVDSYVPIINNAAKNQIIPSYEDELLNELYEVRKKIKPRPEDSFTKKRARGISKRFGDISLDGFDNLLRHTQRTSHYVTMAPTAQYLQELVYGDEDFQSKFKELRNEAELNELKKWIDDVVTKSSGKNWSWDSQMINKFRRRSGRTFIGLNVLSWARQPVSIFQAMAEGPVHSQYITKAAAQTSRHWNKTKEFVYKRSPQMERRFFEQYVRVASEARNTSNVIHDKSPLIDKSLSGAKASDRTTVVTIWKGMYDMVMDNKVEGLKPTEENAIEYADYIIRKTQPTGYIKDLAGFHRGGTTASLFTMFQNQANQVTNYIQYDLFAKTLAGKRSIPNFLWGFTFASLINSLILGLIQRGRLPRDLKEVAEDLIVWPLGGYFFIGPLIRGVSAGFTDYGLPAFEVLDSLSKSMVEVSQGDLEGSLKSIAMTSALATGLPWSQPYRTTKGLLDWINGETDDWRRLFWSEWALQEPKKELPSI